MKEYRKIPNPYRDAIKLILKLDLGKERLDVAMETIYVVMMSDEKIFPNVRRKYNFILKRLCGKEIDRRGL